MRKLKIVISVIILLTVQLSLAQAKTKAKSDVPLFNKATNCHLRYYYYPNTEAYLDTQKMIYYYRENGEWQTAEELPTGYRGYSMYNKYSVYITDYDDDLITQFINIHKKKYPYITNEKSKQLTVSTD